MQEKYNRVMCGRLNARRFRQIEGQHYDGSSIHAPVTNTASIRIVMTLMLMAGWVAEVVDVKGAFLYGKIIDGEEIFVGVPKGFEKHYLDTAVLKLLKCIYGLKQAAMSF